jgi:hypothetical protein
MPSNLSKYLIVTPLEGQTAETEACEKCEKTKEKTNKHKPKHSQA